MGNATLVVAERNGWRIVLGASKPRPSAKVAHPYRKRACLEALRLATTKLTQQRTGYPSWGHPTQFRISRQSTGLTVEAFARAAVTVNELKITNTFFRHKEIHKMTWSARGYRSIINYILTKKKLSPVVNDTKVFRGYDVITDHYLLTFDA